MECWKLWIFGMICYFIGALAVALINREPKKRTNEKPIIRHCKNCEYHERHFCCDYCDVKYQYIELGRPKALFCRFYKKKEGGEDV